MNPRRRRRSIRRPRLLINDDKKYFDELASNSQRADDDSTDHFSFDESISEYDTYSSSRFDRVKRGTVPDHTEAVANNRELFFESLQFDAESDEEIRGPNKGRRKNKNNSRGGSNSVGKLRNDENDDNKEPPLDKLVKDIRTKVKDSKKFWSNLPYQICNNDEVAASPSNDANCWNGNKIDR